MRTLLSIALSAALLLGVGPNAWASRDTMFVPPPNGTDDTANLQAALDACVAYGPNCEVQLAAGTYHTNHIYTEYFRGTVKGRGMDVTIVESLPNLVVADENPFNFNAPPTPDHPWSAVIVFADSDALLADMSFRTPQADAVTPWYYGGLLVHWIEGFVTFIGRTSAKATLVRVAFEGYPLPEAQGTLNNGVFIAGGAWGGGMTPGTLRLSKCRFRGTLNGWEAAMLTKSQVAIGGSPEDANVFENGQGGGVVVDLNDSVLNYAYNRVQVDAIYPWGGLGIIQGSTNLITKPSRFLIRDNIFEVKGNYEDGVLLIDLGPVTGRGRLGDFNVVGNTIRLSGSEETGPAYAGVEVYGTESAQIVNNHISGAGALFGMAVETSTKAMVLVNRLRDLTADVAPIFLDPGTSRCQVVGEGDETLVLDQGTDNKLINATRMPQGDAAPATRMGHGKPSLGGAVAQSRSSR